MWNLHFELFALTAQPALTIFNYQWVFPVAFLFSMISFARFYHSLKCLELISQWCWGILSERILLDRTRNAYVAYFEAKITAPMQINVMNENYNQIQMQRDAYWQAFHTMRNVYCIPFVYIYAFNVCKSNEMHLKGNHTMFFVRCAQSNNMRSVPFNSLMCDRHAGFKLFPFRFLFIY